MSVLEKFKSTLGAYSETDVRSLLHADHKRILELAKELAETDSAARRKSVLRDLKPFLTAHSRSEEAAVYAPLMQLRDSPDSREAGNEGMVEHNLADIVVERLANTYDATSDMWKAHAKVLHEALEHHIKEEEGAVFEELGEHFTAEEREAMATQFVQGKEKIAAKPVPRNERGRKRAAESVE
ncbi:MAG: hemerythrin domain-containing protein [Casimicrobiaceae bacterium]